jgi:hypothetical protein
MLTKILLSTLFILIFTGCQSKTQYNYTDNNNSDLNITLGTEISSTQISIGSIVSDLAKAGGGKILNGVMGYILNLLGYGDSSNDEDIKILRQMDDKLHQIEEELTTIITELKNILSELDISTDEIIQYVTDPHGSISDIKSQASSLNNYIGTNPIPGSGKKKALKYFSQTLVSNMETDIMTINDAILPPSVPDGVFTTLTHLSYDQYKAQSKTLIDAYNALEHYTSSLIYSEVKGANLNVEARIYLYKEYNYIQNFMDTFQEQLKNQIGNYNNQDINPNSFMYNVWSLALWTMNPLPYKNGDSYFSSETQIILKRADIYRMSVVNEKFSGLRVVFFVTADIFSVNIPQTVTAVNKDNNKTYPLNCKKVTDTIESQFLDGTGSVKGVVYDYWYDGNKVKPGTVYSAYICETDKEDKPIETGSYTVTLDPTFFEVAHFNEVDVSKYDENYTQTPDGNISYGFTASVLRTPLNHYTENSSFVGIQPDKDIYNVSYTASTHSSTINIKWIPHSNDSYSGGLELDAYFNYKGAHDKTLYVDYAASFSGYNFNNDPGWGSNYGESYMKIGVWDMTGKKYVCKNDFFIKYYADRKQINFKFTPTGVCHFTAKSDHGYYVYFYIGIWGDDSGDYNHLSLDSLDYVHIHF